MARWLDRVILRLTSIVRGSDADRALAREIEDHIDAQTAENRAAGMAPAAARAAALRAFGPTTRYAEACRDTRRVSVVQNLARDLGYTLRTLVRQPMLLIAATLSIGAAMAANGVIFTLVNELLLSPPTANRSERLVYISLSTGSHVSYPQWRDLGESAALAGLAGYQVEAEVNWTGPDRSVSLMPLLVTANFFDVTGVPVAIGRGFTASEVQGGRDSQVVVISHRFWKARLAGDPSALGRTLTFNGQPFTVLGILPESLRAVPGFGVSPEVYLPISRSLVPDLDARNGGAVQLIGRLHEAHDLGEGRAALQAVVERLNRERGPKEFGNVDTFARAEGLGFSFKEIGLFFLVLSIAVGLVLAIACANVAGLLLSRASARRREVAVRAAIGASRARLVQQLLTEAFWIALLGTAAGLALSHAIVLWLSGLQLPLPIPLELHAAINTRMLLLAAILLGFTTILCGLLPALHATRGSLIPALKQEEPGYGLRRLTLRRMLVVGQVAVALVLLLTAFLFLRNLTRAQDLDPGFDTAHTLVAQISFVEGRHTPDTRAALLADAVERLRALPGVDSASYSHGVPLTMRNGMTTGAELRRDDRPEPFLARYQVNLVGPEYFATLGIERLSGREFLQSDRRGSTVVAVINELFARRHFPGENPVGRRLLLPGANESYPAEIVGVVANSKHRTIGEDPQEAVYEPFLQRGNRGRLVHVLVRAADPATIRKDVERLLLSLDASAAVDVTLMTDALAFAFLPSRFGAGLLGALGAIGLVLAMVGLYATIAYSVSRRTAELGVRMALGASARSVLRLILGDAALLAGAGIAIGVGAAWFVTQPLSAFLVEGLSAGDPVTFAVTAGILFAVSLGAAAGPALRATRIDPVRALRRE